LLVLLLAALAGCGDRLAEIDPRPAVANLFGAHLEGREPPPGLDQPWPNLSSVPPRPSPPDRAWRQGLSAGLAEDRAQSRDPLEPAGRAALPAGQAGPPPPARLTAAPAVRFDPGPLPGPAPAALPVPAPAPTRPAPPAGPAAAPQPSAPPPTPAPELLAPPPSPSRDLFAPPPPPSGDLLAPRRD
jgi:hypothetical protein